MRFQPGEGPNLTGAFSMIVQLCRLIVCSSTQSQYSHIVFTLVRIRTLLIVRESSEKFQKFLYFGSILED